MGSFTLIKMKLKTNIKIDFNTGLFERKKDFFEAEITNFEVTEFKDIKISGQYYYTVSGLKTTLRPFNVSVKNKEFDAYLTKLGSSGTASMDVIENIFYFILKEEMAKEFGIDINTIDIIGAIALK